MVGYLTPHCLCPQVVERHRSLICFMSRERSAPRISCKWVYSSLLEWCLMRPDAFWWSAAAPGILHRYVSLDMFRPELRQCCFFSSLPQTRGLPFNPKLNSVMNPVVWMGFWMARAGMWSFSHGSWGSWRCALGSLNMILLDTFVLVVCCWWNHFPERDRDTPRNKETKKSCLRVLQNLECFSSGVGRDQKNSSTTATPQQDIHT